MSQKHDVEFLGEGQVRLRAWLFVPDGAGPFPAISMAHGYAGSREHGLERYAQRFVQAGFVVLVHDHRNTGASDGVPRGDVDPWQQISDWRRALSFLETRAEVDPNCIGIWGTSYAGGHVLVLAATDRRIKAVVSQVPTASGYEQGLRRVSPDAVAALEQAFVEDERAQAKGEAPRVMKVVSSDPSEPAAYRSPDAVAFYLQAIPDGTWQNVVTVRSNRAARHYEPGVWAGRISPTPLLMVVATHDLLTITSLELDAFERALQPKSLVLIPGGHFDPYTTQFETSSSAACDWFVAHLSKSREAAP
jgi:fermentation-respiration switch protein FrsA (DUF1100 family)